jgi:hypothetical protein
MAVERIERTIQWFGILKPPTNIQNLRWWRLTADIRKEPLQVYQNARFPVNQTFYGYVQSISAGRVTQTWSLQYPNQILETKINLGLYLHRSVSCAIDTTNESINRLAVLLGLIAFDPNNPIEMWSVPSIQIEEFRVRLLVEPAIIDLIYEYEEQPKCNVDQNEELPPPPPPPPPQKSTIPPTTPNTDNPPISPPYEGIDDDGRTYNPNRGNNPEFPVGERCTRYRITVSYQLIGDPNPRRISSNYWGEIINVALGSNTNNDPTFDDIVVTCYGNAFFEECQPQPVERGGLADNNVESFQVISIEEV